MCPKSNTKNWAIEATVNGIVFLVHITNISIFNNTIMSILSMIFNLRNDIIDITPSKFTIDSIMLLIQIVGQCQWCYSFPKIVKMISLISQPIYDITYIIDTTEYPANCFDLAVVEFKLYILKWTNTQHSGQMGQNVQNWKNYRNTTSQANWGMW